MSDKPDRRDMDGRADRQPKPAIWFLALPFLVLLMVLRPVGCGFVWFGRFLRWLVRPRTLLGLALLLPWIIVFHVLWFAQGWSAFRPLCYQEPGHPYHELIGPMTVEATDRFQGSIEAWFGPDSVRRFDPHRLDVRPVVRMVAHTLVWNISSHAADRIAEERGVPDRWERGVEECDFLEEMLMEGGKARRHSKGWGYWPYNEIDDFSPLGEYLLRYYRPDPTSR